MKYEAIESFPVAAYLAQPGRRGRIILTFAIIAPMLIDAVARFRDWIAVLGAGRADPPRRRVPGGRLLTSLQVVALVFGFSPVTGLPGVAGRGPATAGDPQPDRRSGIAALLCRLRPAGVTGHDRVRADCDRNILLGPFRSGGPRPRRSPALERAATIQDGSRIRTFRKITLPLIRHGPTAGAIPQFHRVDRRSEHRAAPVRHRRHATVRAASRLRGPGRGRTGFRPCGDGFRCGGNGCFHKAGPAARPSSGRSDLPSMMSPMSMIPPKGGSVYRPVV